MRRELTQKIIRSLCLTKYDKLPEYVQRMHRQNDLQIRLDALQELQQVVNCISLLLSVYPSISTKGRYRTHGGCSPFIHLFMVFV